MERRVIFHNLITLDEAAKALLAHARPLGVEEVDLLQAYGRVLAEDVYSEVDVPPFDRSTVDGYAVVSSDLAGASELEPAKLRLVGRVEAGDFPSFEVSPGEAAEVATGAPIPRGADAVVMVEYTAERGGDVVVYRSAYPGENIMTAGSDISAGELVLRRCTRLTQREIGVLAAVGRDRVKVYRRPRVAVISTGNELAPPGSPLPPGKLYDINTYSISAAVSEAGGVPIPIGVIGDDPAQFREALRRGLEAADVVLLSGGTSAGPADLTYRVLGELGQILFHGIMVRPGKPTIAAVADGKLIVGLPGYPSSALMIFHSVVRPALLAMQCLKPEPPASFKARLPFKVEGAKGRRTLYPAVLIRRGDEYVAYPLNAESGAVSVLERADGYFVVPENVEFLDEGEAVDVYLFERYTPAELYFIGSHDIFIDKLIAGLNVKAVYVGSMGGVLAVKRGEADVAGTHMLDPETGEYNIPIIRRLGVSGAVLVRGFAREQGLVVAKGNPKGIKGFEDLLRPDVVMVNRPQGTGTRALLDINLAKVAEARGLALKELARRIRGYSYEVRTHTAVAAAVAQGRADVGMAIRYAAELYGLDFIPVGWEIYDLLVRREALDRARPLIEAVKSAEAPPGYRKLPETGEVVAEF
ncbi:MAG: molybdopterin biosynthesis protein [Thermoproteus sp. AZ2]|uniref:Molybdopterin biosynthesis protein n=1 Tax=Thermoproteus sp. AZ2 TaxID=1609232 RepID=A0ACC6V2H9_9CREN